jgi:hypothetical protein
VDLSQWAILIGCAMALIGVIQLVRHDNARQLLRRGTSMRALLDNPDFRLLGAGLIIALVGYLAAESN